MSFFFWVQIWLGPAPSTRLSFKVGCAPGSFLWRMRARSFEWRMCKRVWHFLTDACNGSLTDAHEGARVSWMRATYMADACNSFSLGWRTIAKCDYDVQTVCIDFRFHRGWAKVLQEKNMTKLTRCPGRRKWIFEKQSEALTEMNSKTAHLGFSFKTCHHPKCRMVSKKVSILMPNEQGLHYTTKFLMHEDLNLVDLKGL